MRKIRAGFIAVLLVLAIAATAWAELTPVNVKNGQIIVATDYEEVCPFSVETRSDYSYYVYLEYQKAPNSTTVSRTLKSGASGKQGDISFIVKPNSKVELHVPIGVYKLYYCVGETWYGMNEKFSEHTRFYSSEDLLDFYADSQYYQGNSLELWAQTSGDFEDHPISESGFPGTEMSSLNGEKHPDQSTEDNADSPATGPEPVNDSDSAQDSKIETVTYEDGTYIGNLKDGKRHGFGSMVYSDGTAYVGYWENDQKNGEGKQIYSNGNSYDGEWKDGKYHGRGVQVLRNGMSYEGEWKDGKKNGYGKMDFTGGVVYEGEWKDDKRNGYGRMDISEGVSYEGEYKDDNQSGHGILTLSDEYVIEAEFKNGLANFQGIITYSDGSVQKVESIDGELFYSSVDADEEEPADGAKKYKTEISFVLYEEGKAVDFVDEDGLCVADLKENQKYAPSLKVTNLTAEDQTVKVSASINDKPYSWAECSIDAADWQGFSASSADSDAGEYTYTYNIDGQEVLSGTYIIKSGPVDVKNLDVEIQFVILDQNGEYVDAADKYSLYLSALKDNQVYAPRLVVTNLTDEVITPAVTATINDESYSWKVRAIKTNDYRRYVASTACPGFGTYTYTYYIDGREILSGEFSISNN